MNENIATGAVTISDGRGNTVTVTGVGVMVQWPSLSGRGWKSSEASIDGWLSGELVGLCRPCLVAAIAELDGAP